MYRIDVTNRQPALRVNARRLRLGVRRVLERERVAEAEISIAVVNDAEIHKLNRRHLQHDYPTDVLSFLLEREGPRGPRRARRIEGEVVVSADTARRRAAEFDWHPAWELLLYVVHGTLHLCGYDDRTPPRRRQMRRRERAILKNWGMTVRYGSGRARRRPADD
jgi:probable rRNA maturation factor